jgi:hypothetical protein
MVSRKEFEDAFFRRLRLSYGNWEANVRTIATDLGYQDYPERHVKELLLEWASPSMGLIELQSWDEVESRFKHTYEYKSPELVFSANDSALKLTLPRQRRGACE